MALYVCKWRAYVTDNYRNEITQAFDRVNPIAWRERVTVDFPANYDRVRSQFFEMLSPGERGWRKCVGARRGMGEGEGEGRRRERARARAKRNQTFLVTFQSRRWAVRQENNSALLFGIKRFFLFFFLPLFLLLIALPSFSPTGYRLLGGSSEPDEPAVWYKIVSEGIKRRLSDCILFCL